MKRLTDRVAIITGSKHGIGLATAKRLASEGAKVVIADIDEAGAEKAADEIRETGAEAAAHRLDLADEASIKDLVDWTLKRFGGLHILHNNASDTSGVQMAADQVIFDMDAATWDRAFLINTRGTMLMTKHVLPAMLEGKTGSIINTSSSKSLLGDSFGTAYGASKAAVNCLTLYVATQYGRRGIRCNAIFPGLVLTPTTEAVLTPDQFAHIQKNSLSPFPSTAEDAAAAVAFLASDDARNINGHIIPVNGGANAHHPHAAGVAEMIGTQH